MVVSKKAWQAKKGAKSTSLDAKMHATAHKFLKIHHAVVVNIDQHEQGPHIILK